MLRKVAHIALLFVLLPLVAMAAKTERDIRQFSWGDSIKQVIAKEKAPVFKEIEGSAPLYKDTYEGIDIVVGYIFLKDKLQGAIYIFKSQNQDKAAYYADYNKVLDSLTKKYGAPKSANRLWKNDDARKAKSADSAKWGEAIANGELSVVAEWQKPKMMISHSIEKVNAEVVHVVTFSSKALAAEKKEEAKRESGESENIGKAEEKKADSKMPKAIKKIENAK